jgi:hypothetical protein
MTGSNLKTPKQQDAAGSLLMIPLNTNLEMIQCAGKRYTGSCPAESRFADAKGQGSQHKCRKVKKKEKKHSIVWKQSWEGNGTNALRKPVFQI